MSYIRNKEGRFVKGTSQPHGFERGHIPWNKGLGGKICPNCGIEFHKPGRKYCSKECWIVSLKRRRGSNNPNWQGGKATDREYRRKYTLKRFREKRLRHITLLGSECSRCGYDNPAGLIFHHTDPTQKEYKGGYNFSDIEKVELVCANCHKEIHKEMRIKLMNPVLERREK